MKDFFFFFLILNSGNYDLLICSMPTWKRCWCVSELRQHLYWKRLVGAFWVAQPKRRGSSCLYHGGGLNSKSLATSGMLSRGNIALRDPLSFTYGIWKWNLQYVICETYYNVYLWELFSCQWNDMGAERESKKGSVSWMRWVVLIMNWGPIKLKKMRRWVMLFCVFCIFLKTCEDLKILKFQSFRFIIYMRLFNGMDHALGAHKKFR